MKRVWILVLLVAACSSERTSTGSTEPSIQPAATGPLASALIVSGPDLPLGSSLSSPAWSAGAAVTTYVSLPPGYLAGASLVRITNLRTTEAVTPVVVAGGFDPIGIPAVVDDTLDIAVTAGGAPITHTLALTQPARPPRVVRVNPPRGKLDVPLNQVIVIVISEPIDPATLNGAGVRLHVGDVTVGGSLALDSTGTVVTFTPSSPLRPATTYELDITRALTDRSGTSLESATTVTFTTAALTPPGPRFASVGAGRGFTCGLTTDGAVYCWGYQWTDSPPTGQLHLTPVKLTGGLTFRSLSVGWDHACGIITSGAAYCWGYSAYGELGDGSMDLHNTMVPNAVAGGLAFKTINAGGSHTCGVTATGTAYCWGLGVDGELGNGSPPWNGCSSDNTACATPQIVEGGLSFASVSAGGGLTCGLTASGSAYCWGSNVAGDLGIGSDAGPQQCGASLQSCSRRPVAVAGGHTFTAISAMAWAACGLGTSQATYCWGSETLGYAPGGQFDDCSTWDYDVCSWTPWPLRGDWQFTTLSATSGRACATTADGTAYCWGQTCQTCIAGPPHAHDTAAWTYTATPTALSGALTFAMVSAGPTSHSCGVTVKGDVYCWGDNSAGQLGDGTRTSSAEPVRVTVTEP